MSTSYTIVHTDGPVMHFANFEKAAAWANALPASSRLAPRFLKFIQTPFDEGSFAAITGDVMVRMHGSWTFTATFHRDDIISVNVES